MPPREWNAEDYVDDAIHARRHWWERKTLCGLSAKPRNVLPIKQFDPDTWSGCWTCMHVVAGTMERVTNASR